MPDQTVRALRRTARSVLDRASSPIGSVLRFSGIRNAVVPTFDDGPDPAVTPALLEALADLGASATFFMLASRVARYPEVAEQVRDAGHEIALHGLDHRRLTHLDPAAAAASIREGKARIEDALGVTLRWYRPPYGAHDLRIWRAARSLGLTIVLWGPSLHDWKDTTEEARWPALTAARAGDILLGHDGLADQRDGAAGGPLPPDLDRAAWARTVLEYFQDRGWSSMTVGEAAATGKPLRGARWTQ